MTGLLALALRLLTGLGVSQRVSRALAPFALAAAALVTLGALYGLGTLAWHLWLGHHDKQVVAADRTAANAAFRARQVEAERKAGDAKAARDLGEARTQQDLQGKLDHAKETGASGADAVWSGGLFDDPAR